MSVGPGRARSRRFTRLKWTAFGICLALAIAGTLLGLRSPMLHIYEYQEDVYLALDGSASVYVSASLPALVALYGMDLPTDPRALLDRARLRREFGARGVTVGSISSWRRGGRRFVTVRLDTAHLRQLSAARPFAASTFTFSPSKRGYRLRAHVGPPPGRPIPNVGWSGREMVGFRWHMPSRIESHNTLDVNLLRGNILVWEQRLRARIDGRPVEIDVEMERQSILSGTLWLFAVSVFSALVVVALFVWWIVRNGKSRRERPQQSVER